MRIDRDHNTVALPAGVQLDLGGIGKGLAADLVASGLVERGALGACVALGGDVRVAGSSAGRSRVVDTDRGSTRRVAHDRAREHSPTKPS